MLIAKAISCEMYVHTTRKERWIESKALERLLGWI